MTFSCELNSVIRQKSNMDMIDNEMSLPQYSMTVPNSFDFLLLFVP